MPGDAECWPFLYFELKGGGSLGPAYKSNRIICCCDAKVVHARELCKYVSTMIDGNVFRGENIVMVVVYYNAPPPGIVERADDVRQARRPNIGRLEVGGVELTIRAIIIAAFSVAICGPFQSVIIAGRRRWADIRGRSEICSSCCCHWGNGCGSRDGRDSRGGG